MSTLIIILLVVVCPIAAVLIARMITKPMKKARSDREWQQFKQDQKTGRR